MPQSSSTTAARQRECVIWYAAVLLAVTHRADVLFQFDVRFSPALAHRPCSTPAARTGRARHDAFQSSGTTGDTLGTVGPSTRQHAPTRRDCSAWSVSPFRLPSPARRRQRGTQQRSTRVRDRRSYHRGSRWPRNPGIGLSNSSNSSNRPGPDRQAWRNCVRRVAGPLLPPRAAPQERNSAAAGAESRRFGLQSLAAENENSRPIVAPAVRQVRGKRVTDASQKTVKLVGTGRFELPIS